MQTAAENSETTGDLEGDSPDGDDVVQNIQKGMERIRKLLLAKCAECPPEERPSDFDEKVAKEGLKVVNGKLVPKTDSTTHTTGSGSPHETPPGSPHETQQQ